MATTKAAGQMIYLVENLSDARLRCDQLKRYLAKAMKLIEKSSKRDHFYEVAGDILNGVPEVIFKLDKALDATGLAASRLDYEELKQQLSPEKVDELEEVLEDVRVKHLERRSSPEKDSQVKFKAASSNRLSEALQRIASGIEDASLHPQEASNRIAFVRMALSQTAQQAVESMGPIQADSREKVIDGFRRSNPSISEADLEEIGDQWEANKSNFKTASDTLTSREAEDLPVGSLVVTKDQSYLVIVDGGAIPKEILPKSDGLPPPGESLSQWGNSFTLVSKGKGKVPTHATAQKAALAWSKKPKQASSQSKFPAAPQVHVASALRRIASEVQACKVSPQDAWNRLAFVRMALSQTAQQAVEAFGNIQADSREKVMDGFAKANPALSSAQLEEIADHWEENKSVVKDMHKSAAKTLRFPEGTMTEREWVEEHADKVEEKKVDWHSLIDKKKWNRMDGEAQKEYEKTLQEKAKKPVFRAWKGDTYHDISKDTYTWAKSSLGK